MVSATVAEVFRKNVLWVSEFGHAPWRNFSVK